MKVVSKSRPEIEEQFTCQICRAVLLVAGEELYYSPYNNDVVFRCVECWHENKVNNIPDKIKIRTDWEKRLYNRNG